MNKKQLHFWYSEEQAKLLGNPALNTCIIDGVDRVYDYTTCSENENCKIKDSLKPVVYLGIGHIHSVNGVVQK